ncbi:uncharacterized protein LOC131032236 [Cryptomeria japonica]|uniref:uncharacterized protein LOC131032236 n=1 Tax=Cryptomeria japonica TaxID=3369 RepID=UPI0027DA8BA9|nr:uncharacterized protein LOC131032236 [Cryptomeria japonica]
MWELWKERNRRLFRNKKLEVHKIINIIDSATTELMNNWLLSDIIKNALVTYWDEKMKKHWEGLSFSPFVWDGPLESLRSRAECRWQPPGEGWVKLNFDGAFHGNLEQAGIGCSVHNWESKEIAILASPIGIKTNNWAELMALVEGLHLCRRLGVKNLVIEGDPTIIINALRKCSMPNWRLNTLLSKAIDLCKGFDRFTVNHIYREGNKRADELANIGADDI